MSHYKYLVRTVLIGGLLFSGGISVAQTEEQAKESTADLVDTAQREQIAQEIIANAFPEEERTAMFNRTMDAVTAQMRQSTRAQDELLQDPGILKILDSFTAKFRTDMQPILATYMPKLFEAMAHAYARQYSITELNEILAFAKTPTGAHFIGRGADLLADPDVAAANTEYLKAIFADMPTRKAALQRELESYLKAKKKRKPSA